MMRLNRKFGSAALVALMAMAFLGPTSAMGETTALCASDQSPCKNTLTHLHATSIGKMKLVGSGLKDECDVLLLANAELGLGAPLEGQVEFTYTNCSVCTVVEENGPSEVALLKEGHETAKITLESWLVRLNCASINCRYSTTGEVIGLAKGLLLSAQSNGEASFQEQTVSKESGFFCPSELELNLSVEPLIPTSISS
jgi:hypothetical protein